MFILGTIIMQIAFIEGMLSKNREYKQRGIMTGFVMELPTAEERPLLSIFFSCLYFLGALMALTFSNNIWVNIGFLLFIHFIVMRIIAGFIVGTIEGILANIRLRKFYKDNDL